MWYECCGIHYSDKAIHGPLQSSIVERMRAAVVVARATDRGGNIFQAVRKDTTEYVETEPDWKQHSLNS
jgi:hypothetical protein